MAKSLNCVDLLGYLGGDAKIKQFPDGTSVGEVSVSPEGFRPACAAHRVGGPSRSRVLDHHGSRLR